MTLQALPHSHPQFWFRESSICADDAMYGCAVYALSEWVKLNPGKADDPWIVELQERWRELGDVDAAELGTDVDADARRQP